MKKIIKPQTNEEAVYSSDFSGKVFEFTPPVTLTVDCSYGSKYDGAKFELHLDDNDLQYILDVLRRKLTDDCRKEFKKQNYKFNQSYAEAFDVQGYDECNHISKKLSLVCDLLK